MREARCANAGARGPLHTQRTGGEERRRAVWSSVAEQLAALDDLELNDALARATRHGAGIGGASCELDLDGVPVFVKVVPLTELERRPEHVRSTSNLFGLPPFLQYGVGSPGFTAWRELAAHERTTRWVLDGAATGYPLLYHWRVLPVEAFDPVEEHRDPDATIAYWHGAAGLGDRLVALGACRAGLVLFLEHLPHQLDDWLHRQLAEGGTEAAAAIEMVDATLLAPVITMNRHGLFHFDSHLRNLLTDGRRVLVADFGLATAFDFDLDDQERRLLQRHELHDVAYTVTRFVNRLVTDLVGIDEPAARNAYIADHASTHRPAGLPSVADAIVRRHAPVAQVVNDFYWRLFTEARDLPFPTEPLQRAAERASLSPLRP